MANTLIARHPSVQRLRPTRKDWNDVLRFGPKPIQNAFLLQWPIQATTPSRAFLEDNPTFPALDSDDYFPPASEE